MNVPAASFGYPDARGLLSLRIALVEYLARVRGVRTSPDRIVICSGFTQALSLLSTVLRDMGGKRVAVESYGLEEHRRIIQSPGLSLQAVSVDAFGVAMDDLEDNCALLLTPTHQFPTGVQLTGDRREQVFAWARKNSALIIEDDYDGEFRFDREPVASLQGQSPDSVAYVGTSSKSLAPGLSIAWLVLPSALVDPVVGAKTVADGFTGVLEQMALEEFIRAGDYDHHVRQSRLRYRKRRDALVSALADRCPEVSITGISAGLHAVVEHRGIPASEEPTLQRRAALAGLKVRTLGSFRYGVPNSKHASLVIGYGSLPNHRFTEALDLLCEILH